MAAAADTTFAGPYATAARLYRAAGWHGVLPVGARPGEKWPPPRAYTGHGRPDPSAADVEAYIETHGDRNIALRLPEGVIGLDVDAYEKDGKRKQGAEALAELEARYGALPPTWVSGARPAPSGIYYFRVPLELDGRPINWPGEAAKGIEIIQHGHRYALVWPSTNPEAAGALYEWHGPDLPGDAYHDVPAIPDPTLLPYLPEPWVRGLALSYERTDKAELGGAAMAAWWDQLRTGPACPRVTDTLSVARQEIVAGQSGRHETARDAARAIAAYGGEGHAGVPQALTDLGQQFTAAVAGPGRDADAEWLRLLAGAVELAASDNPAPRQLCACSPPSLVAPPPPFASAPPGEPAPAGAVPLPDQPVEAQDLSDAHLTQVVHGELLEGRYLWARGHGWRVWDGMRWRDTSDEAVVEAVRLWAVKFVENKVANPYIGAVRETRQLLIGLLSKYRLTAIVALARGLCEVDAAAFDVHPDLLNTPSGVVDLTTGELLAHDPLLRMTKIAAVPYVPDADHPDWRAALTALPSEVADWLQVRFGQAITGHMTPDDVLLILRGGGQNAKSTLLNAVKECLGDYGIFVSDRVLLSDPGTHPTELMDFRGARFAMAEELPDEARLNVKRLKDTIGTPTMKARRMRQDPVEFPSTHGFFVSTNPLPLVTETDHGTWRRLALVEFPYTYRGPGESVDESRGERRGDPGLRDRLRHGERQREAVLRWLVAGAQRWYAADKVMPSHPERVREDTAEWRASSDPIEGFWRELLRPSRQHFITAADMMAAFNDYLDSVGQRPWSDRRFTPLFGDHSTTKRHGVQYRQARVREGEERSYRVGSVTVQSPFVPAPTAVGSKVRAWWGVRFVTHTDADQD